MASTEGLVLRSVPARAALHARSGSEIAREAQGRPWYLVHRPVTSFLLGQIVVEQGRSLTAIDVERASAGASRNFVSPVPPPPPAALTAAGPVPLRGRPPLKAKAAYRTSRRSYARRRGGTFRNLSFCESSARPARKCSRASCRSGSPNTCMP